MKNDFIIFKKANGIIHGKFTKDIYWNLEKAVKVVQLRKKLSDTLTYPLLLEVEHTIGISKQARSYLASDIGLEGLTACALLVNSHIGKFAGNLFLLLNKPRLPFRIFNNLEEAIKWLHQFKQVYAQVVA